MIFTIIHDNEKIFNYLKAVEQIPKPDNIEPLSKSEELELYKILYGAQVDDLFRSYIIMCLQAYAHTIIERPHKTQELINFIGELCNQE